MDSLKELSRHVDWKRAIADPVYFGQAVLGITLHEGQAKWLAGSNQRENLLVTGNRWGKSFVCAVKIVHHALFRPRSLKYDRSGRYRIVTASITQDQAGIIYDQVVRLANQSDLLSSLITRQVRSPYPRLDFGNGTIVEARSTQNRGEYLLGHDYDLFIFDEVAFESDPEYAVEEVIQMRLADREGKLDLVSTPNGRNWFYRKAREIRKRRRGAYIQSGDSRQNPYISREFLDDRLDHFSQRRIQQNIMGQFVDSGGEIIKGEYVDSALHGFATSTLAEVRDDKSHDAVFFISGWDLARKKTATVGITVAVSGKISRVVCLERFRMFDWNVVIEKIKLRQHKYPGRLVIDATGLGDVVAEQMREYKPETLIFTAASKAELLTNLELIHARGEIFYPRYELEDGPGKIWSLEDELRQARWDKNNECDALMALALALWPLRKRSLITPAPRFGKV